MGWIEDFGFQEGNLVKFLGDNGGHKHWGFIEGAVYEIERTEDGLGFKGKYAGMRPGIKTKRPPRNWGDWEFELVAPLNLENK